jgi:hypothetical protein
MELFEKLNSDNFTLFAIKYYDNPQCESIDEFYDDLRRFRYLKRLLYRYHEQGELKERLVLNHLIVLFNVFGFDAGHRMLEYKIPLKKTKYWGTIKTMLLFLGYVKEDYKTDIPVDNNMAEKLRKF